ncbi:MAG: GLPGLI family protein [Muribaculaceae bacterium]|nr:GLPGLI family protein [Muribaculaceae bacterium]
MKKLSILILSLVSIFNIMEAQMQISFCMDTPDFTFVPIDMGKYETLDTCRLTLTYQLSYRASVKDDSLSRKDLMDLNIGEIYNSFYSRILRETDLKNYKDIRNRLGFTIVPDDCIGFEMMFCHVDSTLAVTNRLPFTSQHIEYSQKIPKIDWNYSSQETDTIMGYPCRVATARIEGREWKVWYTPDIPLPYGPWLLNGTKGLVLKGMDNENNFKFEAQGLSASPSPIIRYKWDRKKMEKEKWRDFEREFHKNAGMFARSTGVNIIIKDQSARGYHPLNENWEEFYNPLEK